MQLCEKYKCLPDDITRTRRDGPQRTALSAKVDDIVKCMSALDHVDGMNTLFVAHNISRVPSVSPEEATNLVSHAERLSKLELQVKHLMTASTAKMDLVLQQAEQRPFNRVVSEVPSLRDIQEEELMAAAAAASLQQSNGTSDDTEVKQPSGVFTGKKGYRAAGTGKSVPKPQQVATPGGTGHGPQGLHGPSARQAKKWGHRKKPVYGTKQDDRIQGGKTEVDIFVFRVSKKIPAEKIKSYLTEENIEVESIEQASTDDVSRFRSFHVVIPRSQIDKVMNPEFWPNGVGCRLWGQRSKKRKSDDVQNWSHGDDHRETMVRCINRSSEGATMRQVETVESEDEQNDG